MGRDVNQKEGRLIRLVFFDRHTRLCLPNRGLSQSKSRFLGVVDSVRRCIEFTGEWKDLRIHSSLDIPVMALEQLDKC